MNNTGLWIWAICVIAAFWIGWFWPIKWCENQGKKLAKWLSR